MRPGKRFALPVLALALAFLAVAVPIGGAASRRRTTRPTGRTADNLRLIGVESRPPEQSPGPPPAGPGTVPWDTRNTDLAFWGKTAIQGRYDGFRIVDFKATASR